MNKFEIIKRVFCQDWMNLPHRNRTMSGRKWKVTGKPDGTSGLQSRLYWGGAFDELFRLVQTGAYRFGQRFDTEGFSEKPDAFGGTRKVAVCIGAVTAHVNGLQVRLLRLEGAGQFPTGDAVGHDEVGKQQVNLIKAGRP